MLCGETEDSCMFPVACRFLERRGGKKTEQPAELGIHFERELRKGLAVGLVIQVGVAEEARAPLRRARRERHTLQRWWEGRQVRGTRLELIYNSVLPQGARPSLCTEMFLIQWNKCLLFSIICPIPIQPGKHHLTVKHSIADFSIVWTDGEKKKKIFCK